MRKNIRQIARRYIAPCSGTADIMVESGNVNDIIQVILHADKHSLGAADEFAPFLRGANDLDTLRNVYHFVRQNIRYVRDPENEEIIKTPGCTLAEGKGDCKSMTILTGSLLRGLGYTFSYRVAFYDRRYPQQGHIYSVVDLDGQHIIIDPVHDTFNEELEAWKTKDYTPVGSAGIGAIPKKSFGYNLITAAGLLALILLLHD